MRGGGLFSPLDEAKFYLVGWSERSRIEDTREKKLKQHKVIVLERGRDENRLQHPSGGDIKGVVLWAGSRRAGHITTHTHGHAFSTAGPNPLALFVLREASCPWAPRGISVFRKVVSLSAASFRLSGGGERKREGVNALSRAGRLGE